jgi:hypothetical protein
LRTSQIHSSTLLSNFVEIFLTSTILDGHDQLKAQLHSLKNPRIFPTGQVTHYNVTIFEKSSYFSHWAGFTGQVTHYNVTILKNPCIFFHWAGNPLQCDHF